MVRKAILTDLTQLAELFNAYRVWYRKEADLSGAKKFLTDRLTLKDSVIFVQEEEGQLNGFTQLYPLFSSTQMRKSWLLNDLFVRPEKRGNGFSKQLLNAGKTLCMDTSAAGVLLETEKINTIGNILYPSAGFHLYNETNFYW